MSLFLSLLMAAAIGAPELPADAVGVLSQAQGEVRINIGEAYAPAEQGQVLRAGDRLLVLGDGAVVITDLDGCTVETVETSLITVGATCQDTQVQTSASGMAVQAVAIGAGVVSAAMLLEDIVLDGNDSVSPASP